MTQDEFMQRLTERYDKPVNRIFEADVIKFLDITNPDYNDLYNIIADYYKYKSFPSRSTIRELHQQHSGIGTSNKTEGILQSIDRFHAHWKLKSVQDICEVCRKIHGSADKTFARIEFIAQWELLYYHWMRMDDEGAMEDTKIKYCEQVKQSIIDGTPENFSGAAMIDENKRSWGNVNFGDAIPGNFVGG